MSYSRKVSWLVYLVLTLFGTQYLFTQSLNLDARRIQQFCDSILQTAIDSQQTPGLSIAIVNKDTAYYLKGFGYRDWEKKLPVDPHQTIFQIGSVGKIFTAIAIMQQVDKGRLNLHTDINHYLAPLKIENHFEKPITLWHLLTHTAGFDDQLIGYAVRNKEEIEALEQHLAHNLPKQYIEPGKEISYSNYSYGLAGLILEKATHQSFPEVIRNQITKPLGMSNTFYDCLTDSLSYLIRKEDIAIPYQFGEEQRFRALSPLYRHVLPAGAIMTTASDMATFMQTLLRQETLSKDSWSKMSQQQFTGHSYLMGYSLGFEMQNFNGIPAMAKIGNVFGYYAVMILFPKSNLGIFLVSNNDTDWSIEVFLDAFTKEFFPKKNAFHPKLENVNPNRFVGEYRINRHTRHNILDLFELFNGLVRINKTEEGNLQTFHDGSWQTYQAIEPLVFQNKNHSERFLVFQEDQHGEIISLAYNQKILGVLIPVKLEKLKFLETGTFINEYFGFIPIYILSYLFVPFFWIVSWFIRKRRTDFFKGKYLPWPAHLTALGLASTILIWATAYFFPLVRSVKELFFGMIPELIKFHYLPFLQIILVLITTIISVNLWRRSQGTIWMRVYYSSILLCSILWLIFLQRWHFIGWNY